MLNNCKFRQSLIVIRLISESVILHLNDLNFNYLSKVIPIIAYGFITALVSKNLFVYLK